MEALGYVGEEKGKLLIYLVGISRKLERPLSAIILSQSWAGKSSLAEGVELLTPPEDVVLYSRISTQALGYLPKDFLKRKLLILEERVGAESAEYSIRVLQSKQRLSQAVVVKDPNTGRMHTRHFEVEGPIAYIETTTNARINHENATRCFELTLDESPEQTRRIHDRQRAGRTLEGVQMRQQVDDIRRRHHNAQRLLEPVHVVVPYSKRLSFPNRWMRTRRDNDRFLYLVEAVAFLHQHQRTRGTISTSMGPTDYIEATAADYRLAYELAREVLTSTLHELTRDAQELWTEARAMMAQRRPARNAPHTFTRRELRTHTGWHQRRLNDALKELVDMEYLAAHGSQGKTYTYELISNASDTLSPLDDLTTPDQLDAWLQES